MRILSLLFTVVLTLSACGKPDPNTLIIGTVTGPESQLVEAASDYARNQFGLKVKIVEFNDYNLLNEALQDKSLDANIFQHQPYLEQAMKAHGYDFEVLGKTFVYPTGIYSKKIKNLNDLPNKATIAIPNDPSNESRALRLLQQAGLIQLNNDSTYTLADIAENPKQLKIKEIDAAQLPRILDDVELAVINTNFAVPAGLNPSRDALLIEGKDSPYANLIVIRRDSPKKKQLKVFVEAMHSTAVVAEANKLFGNAAIAAW